jgi:hypothetical protein
VENHRRPIDPLLRFVPTHSGIAQLAEHLTVNQGVVGSSPTPGATCTTRHLAGRFVCNASTAHRFCFEVAEVAEVSDGDLGVGQIFEGNRLGVALFVG